MLDNKVLDVIQMYFEDGINEKEISKIVALPLSEVNRILVAYETRDMDYNEYDLDI